VGSMRRVSAAVVLLACAFALLGSGAAWADSLGGSFVSRLPGVFGLAHLPPGLRSAAAQAGLGPSHPSVQQQELTAADGIGSDLFGFSVALSADGRTALIGAVNRNNGQGAAYVFVLQGHTWVQQQELSASDGVAGDNFGFSVALSADGRVALISAFEKNNRAGAAYVFRNRGSGFVQEQELTASDGVSGDGFASFLALSAGGHVALFSAGGKNAFQGAAYVFVDHGSGFAQTQELIASNSAGAFDQFGAPLSLSADGHTALIGATSTNASTGAAYIFQDHGSGFTQTQELQPSDGASGDSFANATALSPNGQVAVVGSPGHNNSQGAAYVYQARGGNYTFQQEISASDGVAGDFLGFLGAALSRDGQQLLICAAGRNNFQGAAYVFKTQNGRWTQTQELAASDGAAGDSLGTTAALSYNGNLALIGARAHNNAQGAAYLFSGLARHGRPLRGRAARGLRVGASSSLTSNIE
jgi:hypothetical protein